MQNDYQRPLKDFFQRTLYFSHISGRIDKIFQKDIEKYTAPGAKIRMGSALVLSDWTEPNDNGWEVNFHTGIFKETKKESYREEIENIYSRQLGLLYAQSYEAIERFLKDCLWIKLNGNNEFGEWVSSHHNKVFRGKETGRETMRGGAKLFKNLKRAGNKTYKEFSSNNNKDIGFKELWEVLSGECNLNSVRLFNSSD